MIDSEDWERKIEETTGSIIFIDEGNRFLVSKKFAQLVQGSDNYFVLATREKLPALPYSVNLENFMMRNRNIMRFIICTVKYQRKRISIRNL